LHSRRVILPGGAGFIGKELPADLIPFNWPIFCEKILG
jgi:hypothetical protein